MKFPLHPFGPGPIATIREDSDRADTWREILGGLTAPIKTAVPFVCVLPGVGQALVYDIDTARLDDTVIGRLVDFAQTTFAPNRERDEIREDITRRFGFPIHADDVSTVTNEHPEAIVAGLDEQLTLHGNTDPWQQSVSRYQREITDYDRAFEAKNDIITARVPNLRTVPDNATSTRYH